MNRELENWEEIISSKFDGQEIPFNEGDWDRAEEMIEKAEAKTKRKRWFNIYFLGTVSGALLMLLAAKYIFNSSDKSNLVAANSQKTNSVAPLTQKKEALNPVAKENGTTNSSSANIQNNNQQEAINEKINQLTAENNKLRTQLQNHNPDVDVSGQVDQLTKDNKDLRTKLADQQNQNQLAFEKIQELNSSVINAQHIVAPVPVVPVDENPTNIISTKVKTVNDALVKGENLGHLNPLALPDTTPVAYNDNEKPNPVLDPVLPEKDTTHHSKNIFSFEAGTNYIAGWKYNDTVEARGFNEVVGVDFTHKFNTKWSMSTALRFERIGYLHVSQKEVIDSTPDFGLNNTSTVISPERLFYFSLPVKIERTFKVKNSIGLGIASSYLFNTTSVVETINTTDGYKTIVGDPKREYAYFGGLRRFDASFTLSYYRQLFPKWGLLLEGTYGLIDLKSNSYFTNSHDQAEHIMGARFMLTYKLF